MLEVKNINVFYEDAQALWDISFTVNQGEIVTLVGSNGAGKSTTLKAISGLVPPASGEIIFEGTLIDRVAAHRIVEMGIAHIPEGRRLWPGLSVLENLELGAYTKAARAVRKDSLEWVFQLFPLLKKRQTQLAGTLSGGEQQMLAIGRGLLSPQAADSR
jgi:branched-chain amino acid transport system ATP-binding protein